MLDLFEKKKEYHEEAVADRLGISRQTLRNWRIGYSNATNTFPPKLTEGVEWKKLGNRKSKVVFDKAWTDKMEALYQAKP